MSHFVDELQALSRHQAGERLARMLLEGAMVKVRFHTMVQDPASLKPGEQRIEPTRPAAEERP